MNNQPVKQITQNKHLKNCQTNYTKQTPKKLSNKLHKTNT